MIITLIICVTIAFCVHLIVDLINKHDERTVENEYITDQLLIDIDNIKDIIERTEKIDIYNDTVKHNLLTIKHIIHKYVEEDKRTDSSSTES